MNNSEGFEKPVIILTGNRLYDQVLRCYKKPAELILADNPQALALILRDSLGAMLLVDLALFNDDVTHPLVAKILKKGFEQRIVVMTDEQDPAKLYPLMELGVRGFCHSSINDELLMKAIQAVNHGELWIGRQFISYLICRLMLDKARKNADSDIRLSGTPLTPREEQIATHVAQGKCDKVIARDLNISPHTVKNHLSNIFKKLQVTDRFQLALIYHGIINN